VRNSASSMGITSIGAEYVVVGTASITYGGGKEATAALLFVMRWVRFVSDSLFWL
jgi:hypothetical protein